MCPNANNLSNSDYAINCYVNGLIILVCFFFFQVSFITYIVIFQALLLDSYFKRDDVVYDILQRFKRYLKNGFTSLFLFLFINSEKKKGCHHLYFFFKKKKVFLKYSSYFITHHGYE